MFIQAGVKKNAYSLVGDGVNPRQYAISVRRQETGGGSEWLHANVSTGSRVVVEGPRSMFSPDLGARKYMLVAAGIGVTPVLSHARAAARWGRQAEVIYIYRPNAAAHLDDLRNLDGKGFIKLYEAEGRQAGSALIRERFHVQPLGTHAYACGPSEMLESFRTAGINAGWSSERLHLERFDPPKQEPGKSFQVHVTSTGQTLTVEPSVSLLEKLLEAGHPIPNLCRQGVCGECKVQVKSGTIDHRDIVLSEDEKNANSSMLCCVSRGEEIEVDI
ncbi:ferredoxin-NADP reductase [Neomicrococcus aestuarii]|uniref:Ferredoxin-NADP reductase n=1 Tax=Neomicrococcus aestuarii TaxID=556325 RepID=A0A7W8TTV4_9MICC|nr:PDR/VanB family oxidoreductase [Neomicrococcus aestuarii]MBB5511975.1 ferredoxin-NADP reductase [Neomicrococcus aestuarii]